ncbi:MAG: type III pantothenate kinase [Phycisphaerae bacterium]
MSRALAVALGNTTASASLTDADGRLGDVVRVPIGRLENLKEMLPGRDADLSEEGVRVIVASVNPRALRRFRGIAVDVTGSEPEVAGEDFPIPIRAEVDAPESVGVDRLLAALAAHRRAEGACIVVDAGAAVTVDAVSANGAFQGGAIFPGLEMIARALAEGTALLPKVGLPSEAPLVGKNTREAISAGLVHGVTGAVAALVEGARETVGREAAILLTGGDAAFLAPHLPTAMRKVVPNLVLEGLVIAYREGQQR